jgi:hypothetical protein
VKLQDMAVVARELLHAGRVAIHSAYDSDPHSSFIIDVCL